jgi:KDO2-lipid IV(A) lauroyltransferase
MLVALGWIVAHLPLRVAIGLGKFLGWLALHLARGRRRIAEVNLELCFPQLRREERQALLARNFAHTGVGLVEAVIVWLNPRRPIHPRCTVTGLEHLLEAQRQGRGVLLISAHFTCIDIGSQAMSRLAELDVMYRENKNPVWEWLQVHGRRHYFDGVVERQDVRQAIRRLRNGRTLWYAADQDYGRKHSVFAPFFGIPAATITATARLAKLNGSPVLFLRQTRNLEELTWRIDIDPPLAGFPRGDDVSDAARINAQIEEAVRRHPEQYLWVHRRFKTRPAGEARPY